MSPTNWYVVVQNIISQYLFFCQLKNIVKLLKMIIINKQTELLKFAGKTAYQAGFSWLWNTTAGHDIKYQPIGTKRAGGCHYDVWGDCQELQDKVVLTKPKYKIWLVFLLKYKIL